MSGLTELLARLAERAQAPGALERLGALFNKGAELPGTFQKGRTFADTPERLAAQFDWSAPELVSDGWKPVTMFRDPAGLKDPRKWGLGAVDTTMSRYEVERYLREELDAGPNGISPFLQANALPRDAHFHMYDAQGLENSSGAGTRAYPVLYGNTLLDPLGYNIKGQLSGDNAHRNNYHLASAIMRRPDAGERLLTSPEQFVHTGADPVEFMRAGPDAQVGTLQAEGALQLLARLNRAALTHAGGPTQRFIEDLPNRVSSHTPADAAKSWAEQLRKRSKAGALRTIGPASLRRFGIVQDALEGRPVPPEAFRRLEFAGGGKVGAATEMAELLAERLSKLERHWQLPENLWHKTNLKNVPSIGSEGLRPTRDYILEGLPTAEPGVNFVRHPNETVLPMRQGRDVWTKVPVAGLDRAKLLALPDLDGKANWWRYYDVVPPEALEFSPRGQRPEDLKGPKGMAEGGRVGGLAQARTNAAER